MGETKQFHLCVVLTVTTEYDFSVWIYDLLNFMTGGSLPHHDSSIKAAINECRPYLIKQFPQLTTPEMNQAINELQKVVNGDQVKGAEREMFIKDWLDKQIAKYGEMLEVKAITRDDQPD